MAEITLFVALPFDFDDGGGIAAVEPIDCTSPAAAIQRAQGLPARYEFDRLWRVARQASDWTASASHVAIYV